MPIRIVSDGTSFGTRVIDVETGEDLPLNSCTAITWRVDAEGTKATATLEYDLAEVEVIAESA